MAKCAKCGKEFNPPKDYWKMCYDCWMKERGKFVSGER
jgi:uncharacterized OB-fold protein